MLEKTWTDMFVLGVPVLEKVLRPVLVYFFLVIGIRLAGKRELAQLNPFDLVVLLTISNTVQNGIIGDDDTVLGGVIGATSLLVVNYFVVRLVFGHASIERLVEGEPDVLVDAGKIRHDRLKEELITLPELLGAAHKQGFDSLDEIDRAILEPGGTISFFAKKPDTVTKHFDAIRTRLDAIAEELAALRAAGGANRPA